MKRAQATGPKMVIFTPLLGQTGGLLGQWPTSYNVKKCPGWGPLRAKQKENFLIMPFRLA